MSAARPNLKEAEANARAKVHEPNLRQYPSDESPIQDEILSRQGLAL
ncbi:hypothetical protein J4O75_22180 [Paenibacillus pabuli]